ncbi:MAG: DJ-1/PfpI family protein [Candidatus Margulisiibacteriota bacterium]
MKNIKKAVIIIAFDKFRDEEYFDPKKALESNGISVTTASSQTGEATGKLGGRARVDILLKDIRIDEYQAVIFVGGPGSYGYFDDPAAQNIARQSIEKGKITAAICAGPGILASAGVLKGRKVSCFPGIAGLVKKAGAICTGNGVEIDGDLVTADGPSNARKFGENIAWKILK